MPHKDQTSLTGAEWDVLRVLWQGPASAREVHEAVRERTGWAYSTTRTTLDRLARKGALTRSTFHGLLLYEARLTRARALAGLARTFADRALGGDVAPVVSLFAGSDAVSETELDELERLLSEEEGA